MRFAEGAEYLLLSVNQSAFNIDEGLLIDERYWFLLRQSALSFSAQAQHSG